jgi:hypothetical protein
MFSCITCIMFSFAVVAVDGVELFRLACLESYDLDPQKARLGTNR